MADLAPPAPAPVRRRRSTAAGQAPDSEDGQLEPQQTPEEVASAARSRDSKRSMYVRIGVIVALVLLQYKRNPPASAPEAGAESGVGAVSDAVADATAAASGDENSGKAPSIMDNFFPTDPGAVPAYYELALRNSWELHKPCELRVYLSESPEMTLSDVHALQLKPVWEVQELSYDWNSTNYRSQNVTVPVPDSVRSANGSWYAHCFLTTGEMLTWTERSDFEALSDKDATLYRRHDIIKWTKRAPDTKSLLGGGDTPENKGDSDDARETVEDVSKNRYTETSPEKPIERVQLWKPFVPVEVLVEGDNVMLNKMPVNVAREFRVDTENQVYYPPFAVNEFWILSDHLRRMNNSVSEVSLELSFRPVSMNKFTMLKSVEGMWASQTQMGAMRESEPDMLKRIFVETNPVLLGTTALVSVAHSVLEVLAFRSDITHWRNIKTLEGVSVRTMFWQIAMQLVIFLYLWDNETSWMITIGNGIGIVIEVWKLQKAVKVKSFGTKKLFGFIPWFELEHQDSYSKETKEYDDEAMRKLSYILYPCLAGYAIYSLRYEKHKSWYSWIIGSLVGAVYAFGFLMMLPQVMINHKLKSVAHMPMKAFMFKALNTVIDDMFSFIIKMPWLHRLACFRDDVVFVVYLYQYWKYPVDKTRVNEFGQRGEDYLGPASDAAPETSESTEPTAREAATEAVSPKPSRDKKKD
jgi:Cleft lip and palate transmembrane protein 1 (CLPTM1)